MTSEHRRWVLASARTSGRSATFEHNKQVKVDFCTIHIRGSPDSTSGICLIRVINKKTNSTASAHGRAVSDSDCQTFPL